MIKVPLHTLSVLGVPSQPKMSNLDCWGQGESKDTHMVGVCVKGDSDLLHTHGPGVFTVLGSQVSS